MPQPRPSLWILDARRDLLLFVATPVLILPLWSLASLQWSLQELALFVAAFGALGHHFPGMLRAYGDRQLFERFKTRFIVAPIFLAAVCLVFSLRELSGMILIAALWGIWHGLAQTYGFLRIYDSKQAAGSRPRSSALTARLDFWMCVAWFGTGLFQSPNRMFDLLGRLYTKIGIPIVPSEAVVMIRSMWWWGTVVVTVAFLLNLLVQWAQGQTPSWVKILLMITSFGFWWYASVTVDNLLVGVALFEIFHDVQYLSIVWIYNRNRVDKHRDIGHFMRFLFRRSGAFAGLYVGLVFAYGSLAYVARGLPVEPLKGALQGILVASALLHFYYDGFIWKVRDRSTREGLGLKEGQAGPRQAGSRQAGAGGAWARRLAGWPHALKWAPYVAAAAWLGVTEARSLADPRPALESARALAAALPDSAEAHNALCNARVEGGAIEAAIGECERALELRPDFAEAHYHLGLAWAAKGDLARELRHLRQALRIEPEYAKAHNNLGVALSASGDRGAAIAHFREAVRLDEDYADAHGNLGFTLAQEGRIDEGLRHLERALRIEPDSPEVAAMLARVRAVRR